MLTSSFLANMTEMNPSTNVRCALLTLVHCHANLSTYQTRTVVLLFGWEVNRLTNRLLLRLMEMMIPKGSK